MCGRYARRSDKQNIAELFARDAMDVVKLGPIVCICDSRVAQVTRAYIELASLCRLIAWKICAVAK
jgi:hypothetical protein